MKLERTTAFYWRSWIEQIGGDPPAPPSLTLTLKVTEDDESTLRYSGTETLADGSTGHTAVVDLKRDAERPWIDLAGTVTLSQPGQPDEVIAIRNGRACQKD
jgi:hypothetical protein